MRFILLSAGVLISCIALNLRAADPEPASIISKAPDLIPPIDAPFPMPAMERPVFPDRKFNIRDFGAAEGGKIKNTDAIRKAIESAAQAGGGVVIIPAGKWLTGPIHLDNNINLRVEKDAEVLFSQDPKDYLPAVLGRHEGTDCYTLSPLIFAEGKSNIAVTGEGVLNGQGKPWWDLPDQKKSGDLLIQMANAAKPIDQRIFDGVHNGILRPTFFGPIHCSNILIEGVTFLYGPFWTISPVYCDHIIVRKTKIVTEGDYGHTPNGDGIDPDSCRNVLIEYCDLDTGDDCVTLKSGKDADGLRANQPTENIIVRNCQTRHGHGGVVIGSESSGGVRNVFVKDCVFNGTDRGIRIKTARGRGNVVENIWVRDIIMGTITGNAIEIDMLYTGRTAPVQAVTAGTPHFRNMHFENFSCEFSKKAAISILGLPEAPIEGLTFDHIRIRAAAGIVCDETNGIHFSDVKITPDRGPAVSLRNSSGITFESLQIPDKADVAFHLAGEGTKGIVVSKSDLSGAKTKVTTAEGAKVGAIEIRE